MNRNDVLLIGVGGAGNRMVDALKKQNRLYKDFYINTNRREMTSLENYSTLKEHYFNGADGTGKNRKLATEILKSDGAALGDKLKNYIGVKHVVIINSVSGGTGGTMGVMISSLVKKALPGIKVTLIAAFPRNDESLIDYNNAFDFYKELTRYMQGNMIENCLFVDNTKHSNRDIINTVFAKEFDNIFASAGGELDNSDLGNFFNGRGYNIPLRLNSLTEDITLALEEATKKSVFFIPKIEEATILIANVNSTAHNVADLSKCIPHATTLNKVVTKSNGDTFVLAANCPIPNAPIELVYMCREYAQEHASNTIRQDDFDFNLDIELNSNDAVADFFSDNTVTKINNNDEVDFGIYDDNSSFWDDDL